MSNPNQRDIIVDAMEEKEFATASQIITQGAMGDYYYVLHSGTADIFKDGKLVLQCKPGMGFGELALMYDAPRAATVVATSNVTTWAIDRVTFKQVMFGTTQRRVRAVRRGVSQSTLPPAPLTVPVHRAWEGGKSLVARDCRCSTGST